MDKIANKIIPFLATIIVAGLFYYFQNKIPNVSEIIKKLLETSLAVCGALLGFLLTILTIINTIATRRMNFIKEAGKFGELNHYLKMALWFNLISISIYFIYPTLTSCINAETFVHWSNSVLIWLVSYTWFLNIRFSLIFIKLLTDGEPHRK